MCFQYCLIFKPFVRFWIVVLMYIFFLSCKFSFRTQESWQQIGRLGPNRWNLSRRFLLLQSFLPWFLWLLSQTIKQTGRGFFFGLHSWLGRLYPENSSFAANGHQCCWAFDWDWNENPSDAMLWYVTHCLHWWMDATLLLIAGRSLKGP